MPVTSFTHLHFTGACGRALGPLVVDLKNSGQSLSASDEMQYAPMDQFLKDAGLRLTKKFAARNVPKNTSLLIMGAAITPDNVEVQTALKRGIPICNMAQFIGRHLLPHSKRFVIAGTKGKTTTTAMLAWILEHAGKKPDYLFGGQCPHFPLSVRMQNSPVAILEGDEYPSAKDDRTAKFHYYQPHTLIVTNIHLDHPEIYPSLKHVKTEFHSLAKALPASGRLILNAHCPNTLDLKKITPATVETVGWTPKADHRITHLSLHPHGTRFHFCGHPFSLPQTGRTFALDAALVSRGHQVCVFSTAISNPIADRLTNLQIPFVTDPKACPFQPDIIHGQHHLEAITALCSWPLCPAIYFVHGATPWEETPPKHPRILSYLGTSPRFAWFLAKTCGFPESSFIVAPNFFDSRRFTQQRPPNTTTGRALVFHNTMAPDGHAIKTLRSACETVGLKLDALGNAFGQTSPHPEHILPDYDVVFAAGRSAIEAMASGCAVIPISAEQSADWICPDNFADLSMRNFTAEVHAPPIDLQHIISELRRITPAETLAITQRIRQDATIDRTTEILIQAYQSVLEKPLESDFKTEISSLSSYLLTIAQRVKDSDERRAQLIDQKDRATARATKWKLRAGELTERLESLQLKANTPWWKRLKKPR